MHQIIIALFLLVIFGGLAFLGYKFVQYSNRGDGKKSVS
jgi:hypothetical protein